jgi:hypothetical protein
MEHEADTGLNQFCSLTPFTGMCKALNKEDYDGLDMQIEIGTMKQKGILDEIDVLGGKNWLKT